MTPLDAALWADIAYMDEETGRGYAKEKGYDYVLFSKGPHQCVVARNKYRTIVAFRGTEIKLFRLLFDLFTNLRMMQITPAEGHGKVHRGYYKAAWHLIPLIKPLLKGEVVFTGHSMGGAMAIQAGALLKPDYVYSLNAPKSGDRIFAERYPVQVFRLVSIDDWAQSVPSDTEEWAHVGNKILLSSEGHSLDDMIEALKNK